MHIFKVAAHTLGIDHSKVNKLCIVYNKQSQTTKLNNF